MRHWFTRPDAPVDQRWIKRFDSDHWTVDFPRGAMASLVSAPRTMTVRAHFLRKSDLVGLIWSSEDRVSHPAQRRETSHDYSRVQLSFRWRSTGLMPLDAVNGPTLTIEGRDADGEPRAWFVRLWNYATGSPSDAKVTFDFDRLDGGFLLPGEAQRVDPRAIERMFVSLVPPDFAATDATLRSAQGEVVISDIVCSGSGSVLSCGDAVAPENGFGICTAYDDMYNVPPTRIVEQLVRAGYRGTINHYVGMSHYPALGADGLVDAGQGLCAAAREWHRDLARCAKANGFDVIWSLSFELLDIFCPAAWKQRHRDGRPALTGYDPPSALVSPASDEAVGYLGRIAAELVGLSIEAGLAPLFQVGEPWWWVDEGGGIALYDAAAIVRLGGQPVAIDDVGAALDEEQRALLDDAGALLAAATASVGDAARAAASGTLVHLLAYLPAILDPARPELRRANLPVGWASPAFDVLQIEDYEWVTGGRTQLRQAAAALVQERLGYRREQQHYLAGFAGAKADWPSIIEAAVAARASGVERTLIWAWPQVARDGLTLFGKEKDVQPFDDVAFPIAIGQDASVAPGFSTNIVTSGSGHEFRNANWSQGRLRFDAGPGVRSERELGELIAFFRARRGPAVGFRFRDPFDFSSCGMTDAPTPLDQSVGVGDGQKTAFDLVKRYGIGEERRITRPVGGTVRIAVDGSERVSGWSLEGRGVVRFDVPPADGATVHAGFLFDCPVRFAEDRLDVSRASFAAGEAPSVPLIEIREA